VNESRSLIRNSVRSSESEWLAWSTSILNMNTWSKGGRPPFMRSERGTARARSGRKSSKPTMALRRSRLPPFDRERAKALVEIEKPGLTVHRQPALPPTSIRPRIAETREVHGGLYLPGRSSGADHYSEVTDPTRACSILRLR
jgi:hypothetical protein